MATDQTGSVLRGLGLPYVLTPAHIWDDELTATQQGPLVGRAVPQGSYSLSLQTSGSQSASKQLRVKVQRGGQPGPGGAEVIHKEEADTPWQGHDVQQAYAYQVIRTEAATLTTTLSDPDAVAFSDASDIDKICAVYQRRTSANAYLVEAAVYDPADGTWTKNTVYTNDTAPTDGYHPAIAYNQQDGYLYVCHWIYDGTANLAQIATHRSQDGETWETVSDWALDAGVDISGSPGTNADGYEVSRLRMAFNQGQCLLVAHVIKNDNDGDPSERDWCAQFASTSRGARFQTVGIGQVVAVGSVNAPFTSHSVNVVNGTLTVWFPTDFTAVSVQYSFLAKVPLPSAYASITSRAQFLVDNGSPILSFAENGSRRSAVSIVGSVANDTDGSTWVAGDGTVYAAHRLVTGATNAEGVFLAASYDDGDSFKYMGDGDAQATQAADALVFYSGDSATYFKDFVGVTHRGRQCLIGLSESDTTTDSHLIALWCGGNTTVNLPARIAYPQPYQQSSWVVSYLPFELPANVSSLTTTGSGTDSITTSGLLNRVSSANTIYSDFAPTTTPTQGLIVRYAHTLNSGGSNAAEQDVLRIRTADGTNTYEVSLRFDGAGFRMWDVQAAAQIGTDVDDVDPNSGIDVLVAVVNGEFSCWYRAISYLSDHPWSSARQGHSLTDGGAASSTNLVRFGIGATSTTDIDVHEVHVMSGSAVNGALGAGFTNPDDLRGRTLPRRGRSIGIDDGVQITAIDGSAKKGDTFNIDTRYEHPVERVLHRESPSPSTQWRSTAVTSGNVAQQRIPFVLNPDATTLGSEEGDFGSTLQYVTLKGINWETGGIERYDTGTSAWVEVAAISNAITTAYSYTRRGNQLVAPSLPTTSSGRYFAENECAGWTVKMGSTYRKITGNTPGTLASNISGPKPTFFLAGIDGSEPSTSIISLIPDEVTITFHTDGETGGGWAIRIDAQATAPYTVNGTSQYDVRIGHLSMGRMFIFGTQYGHGRTILWEADDRTEETPRGVSRGVRIGPGARRFRLAWPDPVDASQIQGIQTDPDYITSTSTAGNKPVASWKGIPADIMGVFQRQGAQDVVTYIPRIGVSTGSTDTQTFMQRRKHALCRIASAVQLGSVLGDECDPDTGEIFRIATIVLEEIR